MKLGTKYSSCERALLISFKGHGSKGREKFAHDTISLCLIEGF